MQSGRQSLCEDIRELLVAWNVKHAKVSQSNFLPHEVNVQFNVLCSSMVHWILGHIHQRYVVTVDNGCLPDAMMKLTKKTAQPGAFCHSVRDARYSASALERDTVFWRLED
jgi:hypothetical protein